MIQGANRCTLLSQWTFQHILVATLKLRYWEVASTGSSARTPPPVLTNNTDTYPAFPNRGDSVYLDPATSGAGSQFCPQ